MFFRKSFAEKMCALELRRQDFSIALIMSGFWDTRWLIPRGSLPSKLTSFSVIDISKFQFDLDYCQALLYHEPLAWVIAQALPVFDVKFTFTFVYFLDFLLGSFTVELFIANRGKWLGILTKFFFGCFCWLFWGLTLNNTWQKKKVVICAHATNQKRHWDYAIHA